MKYFKKIAIFLLLAFMTFLFWLDKREIKKEPFTPSKFDIENLENNKKILHNSKLYNTEYRKYLQQEIKKEKEEKEQEKEEEEQEQYQEEKKVQSKKAKSKKTKEKKEKKSKVKEDDEKIKEKTKRARIQREKENNRLDKYIFKHKMKSKKRP